MAQKAKSGRYYQQAVQPKGGKRILVSSSVKGAMGEHYATAWLLGQGFDVFRNVSPVGRADLLAVNWDTNKTIRVDVKSVGFSLNGNDPKSSAARERHELNKGFEIKYLIVQDDGECGWYDDASPVSANDNESCPNITNWWIDKKTGQRFPSPGSEMTPNEWSFFCGWLLKNYPEHVAPFSEQFLLDMSVRGRPMYVKHTAAKEMRVLGRVLTHIYSKLKEAGNVDERSEDAA